MDKLAIFSGNANPELAHNICKDLKVKLQDALVGRFSEGEIRVKINENVRGKDVFIVQPTCPPSNDNLMELLIMIDALRRASAHRITAVIPYFGYARQDRKDQPRVPITAKLVANLLTVAGASRILTMDLHAGQIQGFFDIPVDHLFSVGVFVDYFSKMNIKDLVAVSPDVGSIKMARAYAKRVSAGLAIIDKRRVSPEKAEAIHIMGEVEDKNVIIVDDMIATGSSLIEAVEALKKAKAKTIYAAIAHGILSGPAIERIEQCPGLEKLLITDSVPLSEDKKHLKIEVLSVASLLAEAIKRIHNEESVSCLFD
ncbi:MAG: ribose-phosphate pyrophosphokinase [Candidatus Omnitrophica bacterium]|nr:ribose-phosphate pyrophosphokinase [Candidatus Omnitrophota bacterium]MBU4303088.1 ribose-phosphate pyrophosphokinase [Candidatus Omnitrophota bacterium]MBU4418313.1 ribose-phosphate pyrophosphokinase [Candidatus Omnitrophota bacterium]MBU4468229.1 ribose-phosphate pyrophosphokinase [Candidatus Omnitrophota bacterium]MCG2707253.1 ribose-phosphate pyrophosphokinase [Candidatus Omnitrophota bacterium]